MTFDCDMPRPKLPYLQREKARGKVFWYVRLDRDQPRIRIRGEYHSEEFMENYNAAISGRPVSKKKFSSRSLSWITEQYMNSATFLLLAPATQRQRKRFLEQSCKRVRGYVIQRHRSL